MNVFFKCLGDIATVLQDLVVSVFFVVVAVWEHSGCFQTYKNLTRLLQLMAKRMFGNVN